MLTAQVALVAGYGHGSVFSPSAVNYEHTRNMNGETVAVTERDSLQALSRRCDKSFVITLLRSGIFHARTLVVI